MGNPDYPTVYIYEQADDFDPKTEKTLFEKSPQEFPENKKQVNAHPNQQYSEHTSHLRTENFKQEFQGQNNPNQRPHNNYDGRAENYGQGYAPPYNGQNPSAGRANYSHNYPQNAPHILPQHMIQNYQITTPHIRPQNVNGRHVTMPTRQAPHTPNQQTKHHTTPSPLMPNQQDDGRYLPEDQTAPIPKRPVNKHPVQMNQSPPMPKKHADSHPTPMYRAPPTPKRLANNHPVPMQKAPPAQNQPNQYENIRHVPIHQAPPVQQQQQHGHNNLVPMHQPPQMPNQRAETHPSPAYQRNQPPPQPNQRPNTHPVPVSYTQPMKTEDFHQAQNGQETRNYHLSAHGEPRSPYHLGNTPNNPYQYGNNPYQQYAKPQIQYAGPNLINVVLSRNPICADCTASNPSWVSLNIGCVVCTKCCSIHRGLGTHISKMRSLKLDKIKLEAIDYIFGNQVVNEEFEFHVPNHYRKPNDQTPIVERKGYITAKYAQQLFRKRPGLRRWLPTIAPPSETTESSILEKNGAVSVHIKNLENESNDTFLIEFSAENQSKRTNEITSSNIGKFNDHLMFTLNDNSPLFQIRFYSKGMFGESLLGEGEMNVEALDPNMKYNFYTGKDVGIYVNFKGKRALVVYNFHKI